MLISKVRVLYLQDRLVLINISVLDARTEIIGDRGQDDEDPLPVILHEDIIHHKSFHQSPGFVCTLMKEVLKRPSSYWRMSSSS